MCKINYSSLLFSGFVWTQGSDVSNQHSVTCTDCSAVSGKNLESSTNNRRFYPGGRAETASWCDADGNLWMFGGTGYDDLPSEEPRLLNDLWLFNCTDQSWKMVEQETQVVNETLLPTKDRKKIPKRRRQAASCGVTGLIFVIFGGMDGEGNALSDTWLFDIVISKWLPLYANNNLQNVSLSTRPPARYDMASWCLGDQLVIFGGHGQDAELDDMWSFSLRSLTWSRVEQFSVAKDVSSEQETLFPPPVIGPATWTGFNNTLHLVPSDCLGNSTTVHNVWEFSLETCNWKIMSMASGLRPGCLDESTDSEGYLNVHQHSATWATPSNDIFIFGGQNLQSCGLEVDYLEQTSNLFVLNWTSMCWSKITQRLHSEDLLTPQHFSSKSLPSARAKMTFWQHQQTLYVFGGVGYDGRGSVGFLNDLWIGNKRNVSMLLQTTSAKIKVTMSPPKVFMVVLSAVGGIALLFGSSFCLRRINCRRRKRRRKAYDVHYSPLNNEIEFE